MKPPDSLMGLHPDDQAEIYQSNRSPILVTWLTLSLLAAMAAIAALILLYVFAAPPGLTSVPKSAARLEPELFPPQSEPVLAGTIKLEI